MMDLVERIKQRELAAYLDVSSCKTVDLNLPNGVKLCLCGEPSKQGLLRLDVMTRGGVWHQETPLQAAYANKMLREGTTKHSSHEIAEMFDCAGAWTDFSCSLLYSYASLYTLKKHFRPMAELLHEVVTEPVFDDAELRIQAAIDKQNQKVNFARPSFHSRHLLAKLLFGESHIASRYASLDDYDAISSQALNDFHNRHYNAENTTVLISGDYDDELVSFVSEIFGTGFQPGIETPLAGLHDACNTMPGQRLTKQMPDAAQTSLRMGLFVPRRTDPHYPNLHILTTVFGGYFGSRLMQNIREEKGYTYGISAGLAAYPSVTMLAIASEVNGNHVEDTIAEVKKEMERLRDELISDAELEMVKNYMAGDLLRSLDEPFHDADTKMSMLEFGLDEDYNACLSEALRIVTPHDLREVARRYYDPEALKVAVAGKQ